MNTITVRTAGVRSCVLDDGIVGHVVAADYDDVDVEVVREDARDLDGPVVICESSPGSWHLWGLQIRPWEDVVAFMRDSHASEEFVGEMTRRGEATLRTHSKICEESREVVSTAPSPTAAFGHVPTHPNPSVSWPHAVRLRQIAEEFGRPQVAEFLGAVEESPAAIGEAFATCAWQYESDEVRA